MRILFLADAVFQDLPGGSRMVAWELARGLVQRGHEVTLLVARQKSELPAVVVQDGVRIVRYQGAGKLAAFVREGRVACARLWAEAPFDLVHTHFAYAALGPLQAVPRGTPRVRTFHGPWDEEGWTEDTAKPLSFLGRVKALLKKRLRFAVEAANLRRSDRIIVLSDFFRQDVTRRFGIPEARLKKIVGGGDLARFMPEVGKTRVRQELGLPEDRRLLLSVRRLAPRMGLDRLIDAMPAVVARCPDVLLLIGGKGAERDALARLIVAQDLESHVRLIGFIPEEQLVRYYQSADAFVLPTVALEGFGLVTVESLACGIPVIGTPVGATPEILNALEPRLIAEGADVASLSRAILSFLEGDWKQALTPARLNQFVRERYTWENAVQETEALYRSL